MRQPHPDASVHRAAVRQRERDVLLPGHETVGHEDVIHRRLAARRDAGRDDASIDLDLPALARLRGRRNATQGPFKRSRIVMLSPWREDSPDRRTWSLG